MPRAKSARVAAQLAKKKKEDEEEKKQQDARIKARKEKKTKKKRGRKRKMSKKKDVPRQKKNKRRKKRREEEEEMDVDEVRPSHLLHSIALLARTPGGPYKKGSVLYLYCPLSCEGTPSNESSNLQRLWPPLCAILPVCFG